MIFGPRVMRPLRYLEASGTKYSVILSHILEQCFSNFFLAYHCHNIRIMYMYHSHSAKHVRVPLSTGNVSACFQDTGLPGKFQSCNFSNLTPLDDTGDSVFLFEQWNNILVRIS